MKKEAIIKIIERAKKDAQDRFISYPEQIENTIKNMTKGGANKYLEDRQNGEDELFRSEPFYDVEKEAEMIEFIYFVTEPDLTIPKKFIKLKELDRKATKGKLPYNKASRRLFINCTNEQILFSILSGQYLSLLRIEYLKTRQSKQPDVKLDHNQQLLLLDKLGIIGYLENKLDANKSIIALVIALIIGRGTQNTREKLIYSILNTCGEAPKSIGKNKIKHNYKDPKVLDSLCAILKELNINL